MIGGGEANGTRQGRQPGPRGRVRPQSPPGDDAAVAGLAARRVACDALGEVFRGGRALDDALEAAVRRNALPVREEGLARAIATVGFRHLGTIRQALDRRLTEGLPTDLRLLAILIAGAAQILFLKVPDHAAVDVSVRLARDDRRLLALTGVVNAVLRRIARERDDILASLDPLGVDTPEWLARRWLAHYGAGVAERIARAHGTEPSLDLTPKADPEGWAERLGGIVLPTGSIRLRERTPIRELDGYAEGAWWVQDAAAALPARLLGVRPGERVADLCAAPGGKTAQLAAAGAAVVAVDRSQPRLERLRANLARLGLAADIRVADVLQFTDEPFDAILLDAPCTATGTIRRHPDVAWTKTERDLEALAALQARLLDRAGSLLRPAGRLVYSTCSLEPEEGERQIEAFLARHGDAFVRDPVEANEVNGLDALLTPRGELRTLPFHLVAETGLGRDGVDGFYAARLRRRSGA